jgi:hypothetical protein
MATWTHSKEAADGLVPWLQLGFGIVAGLFAVQQYLDHVADDRVAKVLAFVERYNKDRMLQARLDVEAAWRVNEDLVLNVLGATSDELPDKMGGLVNGIIEANQLEQNLEIIFGFFDELAICANRKICDPRTTKEFFGTAATELYHEHYCYLQRRRERTADNRIGWGLEWFAGEGTGECGKMTSFARVAQPRPVP